MELFVDGEDYVTWRTFEEMEEKYHYYYDTNNDIILSYYGSSSALGLINIDSRQ
jgi:hypothetical protein